MKVKVIRIDEKAVMPTRGSSEAAGYDIYALEGWDILPGENHLFHTGLVLEIPSGYFGGIFARSGLATRQGLRPANCVGVIDSDYRGELMIPLHNDTGTVQNVSAGSRIAQMIILPYLEAEFEQAEALSTTEREEKGFGSTGK